MTRAEMKNVFGGVAPVDGGGGEVTICLAFCRDENMTVLNPRQALVVSNCTTAAISDCSSAYPATTSSGCSCHNIVW